MQLGLSPSDISGKMIGKKKFVIDRSVGKKCPTVSTAPVVQEVNCKGSKPRSRLPDISGKIIGKKKLAVKKSVGKKPTVAAVPLGQQVNSKGAKVKHPRNSSSTHAGPVRGIDLYSRIERTTKMSHSQLISLILALFDSPRQKESILLAESSLRLPSGAYQDAPPMADTHLVSKTPFWVLRHCLESVGYSFTAVADFKVLGTASDDAFLVVGDVNPNGDSVVKVSSYNQHQQVVSHARLPFKARSQSDLSKLETAIVYVPSSGVFFNRFDAAAGAITKRTDGCPYIPVPASNLRLRRHDGLPALNAFLSERLTAVYCIKAPSTGSVTQIHGHSCLDGDLFIVPNYMHENTPNVEDTLKVQFASMSMTDRRQIWLKCLLDSGTLRSRCKQFAPGLLYDTVSHPPDMNRILVIDSSTLLGGDEYNLRIVSHLKSMGNIQDQSTIRIRRMQVDDHPCFFAAAAKLQAFMSRRSTSGNARNTEPAHGRFLSFGDHVHLGALQDFALTAKVPNENYLPNFMQQFRNVLTKEFPFEAACMVAQWQSANLVPKSNMGGSASPALSLNSSVNLGNAPHFDKLDVGVNASVWTEDRPGAAIGWHFVLPNLLVRHNEVTYHGVMVRLSHGTAITWDGTLIRHCTSKTICGAKNNVYGFNVASNISTLKAHTEEK